MHVSACVRIHLASFSPFLFCLGALQDEFSDNSRVFGFYAAAAEPTLVSQRIKQDRSISVPRSFHDLSLHGQAALIVALRETGALFFSAS